MADKDNLMESGTILYLKENTQELKLLRYTVISIIIILAIFILWIIATNRVAFPIKILRVIAGKC